jgi:hypothetical protein
MNEQLTRALLFALVLLQPAFAPVEAAGPVPTPCVAFLHQPKSAGTSVARLLQPINLRGLARKTHHCHILPFMKREQCKGQRGYTDAGVYWGDFMQTERGAEAPVVRRGCAWITFFREPVARLVSALHYCRHRADTPCGSGNTRVAASARSVLEMARFWGSMSFRMFALDPRWYGPLVSDASNHSCGDASLEHAPLPTGGRGSVCRRANTWEA